MSSDFIRWSPRAVVSKYDESQVTYARRIVGHEPSGDDLARMCTSYEAVESEGNLLTTAGLTRITALIIGNLSTTLDATRVRLGVGTSATAATTADASLGVSQYYKVLDAPYPTASAGVITYQATYDNGEANFAWASWGIDVGTATVTTSATPATLVNRKVSAMGTKSSGTWVLTVTITLS